MAGDTAPVVVGVNGSAEALASARWAGAVAAKIDAPLHILTAKPSRGHLPSEAAAAFIVAAIEEHRQSAGLFLEAAKAAVSHDHPDLVVTTLSVEESADEALPAASRAARLLVVGCDDVTATGAVLVGSTTLAALARSACPVVAWRGERIAPSEQPVVVGVDGSAKDGGALGTAFELADQLGAPLRVIHSWTREGHLAERNRPIMPKWDAYTRSQWQHLNELVDCWRGRHPLVKVTLICEPAKPGQALVLHALGAQLVVVGSRRRHGLTRGLFGSTSLNLLHHSSVPVLLCPFDER
jgi:nucleotide-binding universal stress UspA family protein